MKRGKQRIKISLAKPLQDLLEQLVDQGGLEQKLHEMEARLKRLERSRLTANANDTAQNDGLDAGIFFTDADDPPALSHQQQASYAAWSEHFTLHPEEIEPGRTIHEMAALRAATQTPNGGSTIDPEP